ncbi:hypothetical protein [Candidatus Trichorickettsia mobilis]|uniref:hypothetical protein n=1 Tax=Candidatus Trichorickettsia mobilis TaxID=1346319 RepID=UPI00292E7975|nr:hypothetical protein [Candidatus Trichorickettsia mobilis]
MVLDPNLSLPAVPVVRLVKGLSGENVPTFKYSVYHKSLHEAPKRYNPMNHIVALFLWLHKYLLLY